MVYGDWKGLSPYWVHSLYNGHLPIACSLIPVLNIITWSEYPRGAEPSLEHAHCTL